MRNPPGKITDEELAILRKHLGGVGVRPCPECGGTNFDATGPWFAGANPMSVGAGQVLPFAAVTCTRCGYQRTYNWLIIFKAPPQW